MKVSNSGVVVQDIKTNFIIALVIVSFLFAILSLFHRSAAVTPAQKRIEQRHQDIQKDQDALDKFRL